MFEKEKISLIIPIYNAEKFLEECVKSIQEQTYNNLEIILVNDGSKDNSAKIIDKFAKEDSRVKVVHKENGGVSSARNAGLDVATGEYIMFPDADDLLFNNSCEVLLNKIKKEKADFVIGNFNKEKYNDFKLDIKDYKESFFVMNSAAWNKIFNHKFLNKVKARFLEGYSIAEDAIFTTYCFFFFFKVYYINDIIYAYRQRQTLTSASVNCTAKYFMSINKSYQKIYENFKEYNEINFYRCFYAKSMTYMLYKFIDSKVLTDEERLEILSSMRWFYKLSVDLDVPACQESLSVIINKIIVGDYKDAIDICRVVADVREKLPAEIKEGMSKPALEMYSKITS